MTAAPSRALDLSPLIEPVTGREREATRRRIAGDKRYGEWALPWGVGVVVCGGGTLLLGAFLALMLGGWVSGGFRPTDSAQSTVTLLVALAFVAALFAAMVVGLVNSLRSTHTLDNLVRVERFAAANGPRFHSQERNTTYAGHLRESTWLVDHVRPEDDGDPDYGTIGTTGRRGTVNPTTVGYLAIRLDRQLPHVVLHRGGASASWETGRG